MIKGKDSHPDPELDPHPDPYLWLKNPDADPGGAKTYRTDPSDLDADPEHCFLLYVLIIVSSLDVPYRVSSWTACSLFAGRADFISSL